LLKIEKQMESIKKARKICRITQSKLADSLGMEKSNYCNVENGKLILNTLPDLKKKAIDIILPKLALLISEKDNELRELRNLHESLYNDR
jgi:DNA-binding XRE family transcriptional regulator